ncbi:MAG: hypothetical protein ACFB20_01790 [Opitutales bacterium]
MTYLEFKQRVESSLSANIRGLTWRELKVIARLPYARPCPNWTARLEAEIGLVRERTSGNTKTWRLADATHR